MKSLVPEGDLRPYQTHFIFASQKPIDTKTVGSLFDQLKSLIDFGIAESERHALLVDAHRPRDFGGGLEIGWIVYRRAFPVTWATGPHAPLNTEHHWLGLVVRKTLLSLVSTDKSFVSKAHRAAARDPHWKSFLPASADRLEAALVQGRARTLWLSGIHRSVPTKADSKVLMGRDLEASLDALGDQSYHYTSTRCDGPGGGFTSSTIGVTPRQAKVWLGPTTHWEAFVSNAAALLELVGSAKKPRAPYAILARASDGLTGVMEAFDVSFTPPEYRTGEDSAQSESLERLINDATWTVTGAASPSCKVDFMYRGKKVTVTVDLKMQGEHLIHDASLAAPSDDADALEILGHCNRKDVLKIYYDSMHTYSEGQIFEVKTRDRPFKKLTGEDFSDFDVTLEKPLTSDGDFDPSRIGDAKERSLFTWIQRRYRSGWLWCDDGSGEIADFLHLSAARKCLTFIHAKAAHSSSDNRHIAVSAYEVVCAQALKNLRFLEKDELMQSIDHKINVDKIARCWKDGKRLAVKSQEFKKALAAAKYQDLDTRVVILQPHVRKSQLPKDLTARTRAGRQARLLYTLLHAVDADIQRLGAELEVIVAK